MLKRLQIHRLISRSLLAFSSSFSSSDAFDRPHPPHCRQIRTTDGADPCAGSSTVANDIAVETVTTTTGEVIDDFAQLSRRSIRLKQIVNTLKNDYVSSK